MIEIEKLCGNCNWYLASLNSDKGTCRRTSVKVEVDDPLCAAFNWSDRFVELLYSNHESFMEEVNPNSTEDQKTFYRRGVKLSQEDHTIDPREWDPEDWK